MSGDWSNLPKELVDEIVKRICSRIDSLRFGSVCSSWKTATSHQQQQDQHYFPCTVPDPNACGNLPSSISEYSSDEVFNIDGHSLKPFYLWERMTYYLNIPNQQQEGWVVKLHQVKDYVHPSMSYVVNPFSERLLEPLPDSFPCLLDLMDLHISELGREYVLLCHGGEVYIHNTIFSPNSIWNTPAVMTITAYSGILVLFRFGDEKWSIVGTEMPLRYNDVIHYKGKFYAVDEEGRTVVVCPDLTVEEVASSLVFEDHSIIQSDKMENWCRLIESDGELLLVILGTEWQLNDDVKFIKVFMLDWDKGNWIEVKSLGDHVLFLGKHCRFSASSSQFSGFKGNCIYFSSTRFCGYDKPPFQSPLFCVYNMADGYHWDLIIIFRLFQRVLASSSLDYVSYFLSNCVLPNIV